MEILAPVGNIKALHAAISSGADAVYLGMEKFNARAKADNFNESNLAENVKYAHIFGCKVYLTMNTIIKDNEMSEALNIINFAKNCNVDAFIVQDLGLISQINSTMSDIVLHSSTQMGIHNLEGAKIAEQMGFKRIILARETLLEDIQKIHDETNLEIEFFVQGALCVAFSGNCYFSSLISGYSGNRGKCMQLCRKKYRITKGDNSINGYFLSSKDLCLAKKINELKKAGVCSIKIEGRLRSPEYVSECVNIYRKAINSQIDDNDIDRLKIVFNRGDYCEGYLMNPTAEIVYPKTQGNIGLNVGMVSRVINKYANLKTSSTLSIGDGVKYLRDGVEVGAGVINGFPNTTFVGDVQKGDFIHLTSSLALTNNISNYERKISIDLSLIMHVGQKPLLKVIYKNLEAVAEGTQLVQRASKCALSEKSIIDSITKLGETFFVSDAICTDIDDNVFYPISLLNELRRNAILCLENKLVVPNTHKTHSMSDILCINWIKLHDKNNIFLQFDNLNQIKQAHIDFADYLIFNPAEYSLSAINDFFDLAKEKAVLNLPIISRGKDMQILKNIVDNTPIKNYVANNLYALELCKNKNIIAGFGMNIINNFFNCTKICSIESEQYKSSNKSILYAYGKLPLMTLSHCHNKHFVTSCNDCKGYNNISLTDEKGFTFNLRHIKIQYCYSQLINNLPLNLLSENKNAANILIDFSTSTTSEIDEVISNLKANTDNYSAHTHGNFRKILK